MSNIFFEIGVVIILASVFAFIARFLKQPLIPAYIIAGLLIGPIFGFITDTQTIYLISEIGIAFLLFIVGLEIDLKKLRSVAIVSTFGGFIKIAILFGLGFIIALWFDFLPLQAVYIGLILSFSSTMVVLKLLSDKRELDTLHGRIVVGTLLLEDIIAIFSLTILTTIKSFSAMIFTIALLKGAGLILVAWLLSRFIFPKLFAWAADNQEVLFLGALTIMFSFSLAFYWFGFSIAIGAFIAGVSLGSLYYNFEIMSRIKPLRDFFATIFFVALGMQIIPRALEQDWILLIILILIAVVLKPILVLVITSIFGYKSGPSFKAASTLGQISEFGLIIASQGLVLGHIGQDLFSLTIVVAVVSITTTSYMVKYDTYLSKLLRKPLHWIEKISERNNQLNYIPKKNVSYDIVLAGHNRIGYSVVEQFKHKKKKLLVVDYNPEIIAILSKQHIPCLYGDVSDSDVIDFMNLKRSKLLVSTVPDMHTNLLLLHKAKKANSSIHFFCVASKVKEALHLYDQGADYVIMPHFLGGEHVTYIIKKSKLDVKKILKNKLFHIQELQHRKQLGHEHPREHR